MAKKKTSKQDNIVPMFLGLALLMVITIALNIAILDKMGDGPTEVQEGSDDTPTVNPPTAPPVAPTVDVSADDDAVKGDKNAPVEIIEFSDFQCPFCARFYTQTFGQIDEEYIKTGKVKLVFRDFPLNSIHPQAQKASEASECAADQGKFWEMHDTLFENAQTLDIASLKGYAADLGLDQGDFDECLDSDKYASEVAKDLQDGQAAGVTGTPSFFINGKKLVGAHPFDTFKQVIDAELE